MRTFIVGLLLALLLFPLIANAVEGDVWGTWTGPDTVYVTGEIRVPPGSTLVIDPGVTVNFQGHYKFFVDSSATLRALGTESDSIYFTTDDPDTGWHGIRFYKADSSSQISYCRLVHGKATGEEEDAKGGAVFCYRSDITIGSNTITGNSAVLTGGGIFCLNSRPAIIANTIGTNSAGTAGGGICCQNSNPTISHNTITENSAVELARGGGIFCWNSSPFISHNTITGNTAREGGGIACKQLSCPTISSNIISENSLYGVFCYESSPTISDNIISGNGQGGVYCLYYSSPAITCNSISDNIGRGIYCLYHCSPTIEDNTISYNGGGIYCHGDSVTISGNWISHNSGQDGAGISCAFATITDNCISRNLAYEDGGGITCAYTTITHNTIWRNVTYGGSGGGIFAGSGTTVTNTILWKNFDQNREQIHGDPTVRYCDVQGGWEGEGNIDCDPDFVNPDSGNFHLQMTSCCIDSGDPDPQYNDPDGTRADIGAFYFRQVPTNNIQLMPYTKRIILPLEGGRIDYDAWVYNLSDTNISVDIWAYAYVADLGQYGPFHTHENVRVRPGSSLGRNNLHKAVPAMAPAGEYSYVAYIGDFGHEVIDSSYFTFTKLGSPGGKDLSWLERGDWFELDGFTLEQQAVIATHFALIQNHPNPFNAKTTISYQLPTTSDVKLEVYNLLGRRVATLIDEMQEAGYKSVTWDASEVSSGVYFYKLTAGEFTETRRMMLVK
jgi:parallel beta-helix repeat protein